MNTRQPALVTNYNFALYVHAAIRLIIIQICVFVLYGNEHAQWLEWQYIHILRGHGINKRTEFIR